jgi:hypothetical protein
MEFAMHGLVRAAGTAATYLYVAIAAICLGLQSVNSIAAWF